MVAPRLSLLSFRSLLLLAFILVGGLLGGTALRSVVVLERQIAQRTAASEAALQLTANAQALTERTLDMERAARQSLILGDRVLRRRYEDESGNARIALRRLTEQGLPGPLADAWIGNLQAVAELMGGTSEAALDRERAVAARFREFDTVNTAIAREVQRTIEARNTELARRLEQSRSRVMQQVIGTIALASLLAAALGIWLARPFTRMERAIRGLGENRLQSPIEIDGPVDVRRIGQELEWLRLRLTELDADKARFLRHVSHELKTPLAALREGVSLLEEGVPGELNQRQHEVTRILQHNTTVLQDRIEALLHEQVEAQQLQAGARRIEVVVTGEPVIAEVDPGKLGTAVANLLSNAIRYCPPGGTIHVALLNLPGRVGIEVGDDGPGVSPADRARIFEPFFRGQRQPEGLPPGTGVGLSIVNEYVAAHGGRVELLEQDVRRPGAHFRIELPHAS